MLELFIIYLALPNELPGLILPLFLFVICPSDLFLDNFYYKTGSLT